VRHTSWSTPRVKVGIDVMVDVGACRTASTWSWVMTQLGEAWVKLYLQNGVENKKSSEVAMGISPCSAAQGAPAGSETGREGCCRDTSMGVSYIVDNSL
jgi:hypothetical protein